ncbi:MAG: SDR family NAD(P)-dependent oxidoreductase, partial [Desulfobacterales bacterium]|nr:SDR family NAD(P)-dependent oxidoreductase [Desulfobacterales bacterium]
IGVTSSLTGVFGFPMRSAYAASKHAMKGYFESVGLEYASDGIKVTIAYPGFIKTPISVNSLSGDGSKHGKMDANQEKGMDARTCALRYWKAVIRGKWETVIGGFDTIMVFFYRRLPFLYRFLGKRVSPV